MKDQCCGLDFPRPIFHDNTMNCACCNSFHVCNNCECGAHICELCKTHCHKCPLKPGVTAA